MLSFEGDGLGSSPLAWTSDNKDKVLSALAVAMDFGPGDVFRKSPVDGDEQLNPDSSQGGEDSSSGESISEITEDEPYFHQRPLEYAIENGHSLLSKLLLSSHGVNPNFSVGKKPRQSLLTHAIDRGDATTIRLLLESRSFKISSKGLAYYYTAFSFQEATERQRDGKDFDQRVTCNGGACGAQRSVRPDSAILLWIL